jgi:hypothetical protein
MVLYAQHHHFIYFQHEQSAAFYVKYQGQVYRSSAQGYLILSKIPKGPCLFSLGMDMAGQQEVKFSFDSIAGDRGFLIKNFGDKGWGLFDLQQATLQFASQIQKTDNIAGSKIYSDTAVNDPFGNMLSDVTKDTTVKYVALKKAEIKKDTILEIIKPKEVISSSAASTVASGSKSKQELVAEKKSFSMIRLMSKEQKTGYDAFIFLIMNSGGVDTVLVEILHVADSIKKEGIETRASQLLNEQERNDIHLAQTNQNRVNQDHSGNKILMPKDTLLSVDSIEVLRVVNEASRKASQDSALAITTEAVVPVVSDSVLVKPHSFSLSSRGVTSLEAPCKRVADEEFFIRLRKKMAGRRTEDQMMEEAVKGFKQTCFTTAQIGQLSGMFMGDEMRYRFFDAAHQYVSDPGQFPSLGKYIQDTTYKKRFEDLMSKP